MRWDKKTSSNTSYQSQVLILGCWGLWVMRPPCLRCATLTADVRALTDRSVSACRSWIHYNTGNFILTMPEMLQESIILMERKPGYNKGTTILMERNPGYKGFGIVSICRTLWNCGRGLWRQTISDLRCMILSSMFTFRKINGRRCAAASIRVVWVSAYHNA